jgi:hypothetical protein
MLGTSLFRSFLPSSHPLGIVRLLIALPLNPLLYGVGRPLQPDAVDLPDLYLG